MIIDIDNKMQDQSQLMTKFNMSFCVSVECSFEATNIFIFNKCNNTVS